MSEQGTNAGDNAIQLDIANRLDEMGAREILSITISNVPAGAALSAGTDNSGGTWSLTLTDLDGLSLAPPPGWSGDISLLISASDPLAGPNRGEYR